MGHENTKMVIEHYDRFIPNLTRRDGSALDREPPVRALRRFMKAEEGQNEGRKMRKGYGTRPVTPVEIGAADRIRTGDVQLGKLAFCH